MNEEELQPNYTRTSLIPQHSDAPISFADLAQEVYREINPLAQEENKKIFLRRDIQSFQRQISVLRPKIRSIMYGVLKRAVLDSHEGDSIQVRVDGSEQPTTMEVIYRQPTVFPIIDERDWNGFADYFGLRKERDLAEQIGVTINAHPIDSNRYVTITLPDLL